MIFVLFTYGGWNEMAFVAAEVKEPRKNILRALLVGTLAVTAIYVLVNRGLLARPGARRHAAHHRARRRRAGVGHRPMGGPGHQPVDLYFGLRRDQRPDLYRGENLLRDGTVGTVCTPGWVAGTPGAARRSARWWCKGRSPWSWRFGLD